MERNTKPLPNRDKRGRFTFTDSFWNEEKIKEALLEFYEQNNRHPFILRELKCDKFFNSVFLWLYNVYPELPIRFFEQHGIRHILKYDHTTQFKWTEDALIDVIKSAFEHHDKQPVNDRWLKYNGYSAPLQVIQKKYQSLKKFAEKYDLNNYVMVKRNVQYSNQELCEAFLEAFIQNGSRPVNRSWLINNGFAKYVYYVLRRYKNLDQFYTENGIGHMFVRLNKL